MARSLSSTYLDSTWPPADAEVELTPMERFWQAEDVPASCLSFFHRYQLDTEINESRLLDALRWTAWRHPLPFCQLRTNQANRDVLRTSSFALRSLINSQSPEPYHCCPKIRLQQEPGLRLWYSGDTVWFEYHHLCADGRGALQLERDFLLRYGNEATHSEPAPELSDQATWARLRQRGRARITWRGALIRCTWGWWYLWRGLHANVLPFPGSAPSSAMPIDLAIYNNSLSAAATLRAVSYARAEKVSLNDIVLAAAVMELAAGVPSSPSGSVKQSIRMVIPIDMRPEHGDMTTCANRMSFLYLDVPKPRTSNSADLTAWISRRMRFLKKYMGLVVWRSIQFGPRNPERLRHYLSRGESMLSCYVSNLGVIDELPDFVRDFQATPTLRPNDTPLALMAYTFRQRLHLTAGFDLSRIKPPIAQRFVDRIVSRLGSIPSPGNSA